MECMSGVTLMWSYERGGGPSAGPQQGGGEGQMCTLGLCSCHSYSSQLIVSVSL